LTARARRSYDAVKLQLSSDGGDYGSGKCKRDYGACLEESAFSESLESGGLLCVGAFGSNLASVAVKMFSHLIYFITFFFIKSVLAMRFAKIMLQ
jgi:hypothetical protein